MALYRVKARWDGFSGAPGYSIFHFDAAVEPNVAGATAVATAVDTFYDSLTGRLPAAVTVTVESAVEVIDTPTGQLQDVLSVPVMAGNKGVNAGAMSSAVGACVTWQTTGVRGGRRVRGRTFLVPLHPGTNFEDNGTLIAGAVATIQTSAQALVDGEYGFHVYARPSGPGATDGASYDVASARVADKTAVLRSRRD